MTIVYVLTNLIKLLGLMLLVLGMLGLRAVAYLLVVRVKVLLLSPVAHSVVVDRLILLMHDNYREIVANNT